MSTDLGSDSETLAAIVAYIDAFESDSPEDLLSLTNSDSVDSLKHSVRRRFKERRVYSNRSRDHQRRELESLRLEAERLHARLAELKTARSGREQALRAHMDGRDDRRSEALQRRMVAVWKRVAARQKQMRQDAERENEKLRNRTERHQDVARTLKRFIEKQLTEEHHAASNLRLQISRSLSSSSADPDDLTRVFSGIVTDLQSLYNSNASWIRTAELSSMSADTSRDSHVTMLSPTCFVFELVNRQLFPFEFRVAANSYWDLSLTCECAMFDFFNETLDVDGRTTIFRAQMIEEPSIGRLRRFASMQKINETDRTVVTGIARSDSLQVGGHKLQEARLTEYYTFVFQPPEAEAQNESLMVASGRIVLDMGSNYLTSFEALSVLSAYYSTKMHEHFQWVAGNMEDQMLGLEVQCQ
ncbi:hypothetical protein Poli38472_007521 [Pythium oligandrum]|uniref:Uncharacterized protein n=1 Tax=Pythium oligandrum TaxID=41045 RepID=A0A8K1CRD2_PYTOL|nr:hypothetical protein Poli38472_007521 [Pythium oligandrum]|eukprot:TMW67849.1 hypothetical protein Poli38472_007521 [Pythium oligandrum]